MGLVHRLYHGETAFPLIKERKRFYAVSLLLCLIALLSLGFRGLNLGVEFKGGAIFTVSAPSDVDVHDSRTFVEGLGIADPIVQTVKTSGGDTKLRIETKPLTEAETDKIVTALADRFHVDKNTEIDSRDVGASWGKQVTNKALKGLVAFLIAVVLFISLRFEPKMAAAAMIALVHDLLLAAGVYSITWFVVTPSTIIALLTVLGYSLYDTIVVFDRVDENTKGLERGNKSTYSEAAELAVNQTFMRSINTSLIALLPVSGLLFVGALLLGAGTLKDLALALFVGLASGAYSSLFLATPLLADLKEREPRFQALQGRVAQRRSGASGPVRLSQRSSHAALEGETGEAAPAAAATATAVRRPSSSQKRKPKGARPTGKKRKR
ncbi:MAG TPA: protein translocase subunit SecF [Mycobacteriales bacterium]|nr:protein translocase subunit SecF [Mycobacteriales bacterium]